MTKILGLGNVLMGDDGFGPVVVRAFDAEYDAGDDVEVVDLGTPGLDLTPWLADSPRVIIVDTVKSELPAGTLRKYTKADLLERAPTARTSPHDPGVKETLLTLEFAGRAPRDVTLIGAVPARTDLRLDLSDPVRSAVPAAVSAIVEVLAEYGIPVRRRRRTAPPPDAWRPQLA